MVRLDPREYTYIEARIKEQYYIERYKTINKLNKMNNQRNGISPNSQLYKQYVDIYKTQYVEGYNETYVGG